MYVYVIENMVSGKAYVGCTRVGMARRWSTHKKEAGSGSKSPIHRAIRKYGSECFQMTLLEKLASEEDMFAAERRWIRDLSTTDSSVGYNANDGGTGPRAGTKRDWMTDEWKRKISATLKGRKHPEERVAKNRLAHKGVPWSAARRAAHNRSHGGA